VTNLYLGNVQHISEAWDCFALAGGYKHIARARDDVVSVTAAN
jgi:hypothetical protein